MCRDNLLQLSYRRLRKKYNDARSTEDEIERYKKLWKMAKGLKCSMERISYLHLDVPQIDLDAIRRKGDEEKLHQRILEMLTNLRPDKTHKWVVVSVFLAIVIDHDVTCVASFAPPKLLLPLYSIFPNW